jgi:hypothetical protein
MLPDLTSISASSMAERMSQKAMLEFDSTELNQALALPFCLSMISAQTLRVCREGKPVSTFPDHAQYASDFGWPTPQ